MDDNKKLLFKDFSPVTKQEWIEKANIDLKGADFNKKLVWKNLSKIDIQPFYHAEDPQNILTNTGKNATSLINYRRIAVRSAEIANKLALKAIEEGINGLIFEIKEKISASILLKEIDLHVVAVSFNLLKNEFDFAKDFLAYAEKKNVHPEKLKGHFDLQIFQSHLTTGAIDFEKCNLLFDLVNLFDKYPNFKAITICGGIYLDCGANQTQEIAYTLNALVFLVETLDKKGLDPQTIFNNLHFELGIGSEYFVEIGKFRAFNSLLHQVAEKYNIPEFSHLITAKTAVWNKAVVDAHTNMLRATTEAMSAILGNADAVLIDPYDSEFKEPTDFSSRIAGNIATILQEESYFSKVSNPVDGSYYIEEVSRQLAEKALELFKYIEQNGGYYTSFNHGVIQQQIAEIKIVKTKLIKQRRLPMVGVNKYPNLTEKVDSNVFHKDTETKEQNTKVLTPQRATLEIEALKNETDMLTKKLGQRPTVALTSYGHLAMRKARASFAFDFMGVSGFNILAEQSFENAEKAAEQSAANNANVVVICSSDQDYANTALNFVKTFRAANKGSILLLAGNPAEIEDKLMGAGLDGFINIQSNLKNTISSIQNKIYKNLKPLKA